MLKFSANLGMMFGEEEDPIKRMELAKTSGFPKSSKLAIAEKVVPRSIPITLDINLIMLS